MSCQFPLGILLYEYESVFTDVYRSWAVKKMNKDIGKKKGARSVVHIKHKQSTYLNYYYAMNY